MTDTLNEIFEEARKRSGAPNNTRAVVGQVLYGDLWVRLTSDITALRKVVREGLNGTFGKFIKRLRKVIDDLDSAGIGEPMLDLWPEAVRQQVKLIDRAAVFVPSTGEYVDMLPDQITPRQAIEAGKYLMRKGEDCIRRGNLLIELGDMSW